MIERIPVDDARWSAFLADRHDCGPFHHPAWSRLLSSCYGFSAFVLADVDDRGFIRQGIPLVEVGGRLQKRGWVSLPYSDYVPALVTRSADQADFWAGVEQASRDARVDYVQVRDSLPERDAFQQQNDVIHLLELDADPDAAFKRFHKMAVRGIRRAQRDGVTIRRAERREDLTEAFYRLHLITRRRQGSPIQPKRFFRMLWDQFISDGMGQVLLAYRGPEPIAATVFLGWKQTLIYKFSASNPAALNHRPNHLIIWCAIEDACVGGMRVLDFGRSDIENVGLREFKTRWGATESPLLYTTLTAGAHAHQAGHAPRLLQTVIRRSPPIVCRAAGELLYRYAA
jgi:CelD/BcsL family acetyltransferase involved in cellulose biosynthesis